MTVLYTVCINYYPKYYFQEQQQALNSKIIQYNFKCLKYSLFPVVPKMSILMIQEISHNCLEMEPMLACMRVHAHTLSLIYTKAHIHLHKHKQSKNGLKPLTFSVSIWKAEVWFSSDFKTQA